MLRCMESVAVDRFYSKEMDWVGYHCLLAETYGIGGCGQGMEQLTFLRGDVCLLELIPCKVPLLLTSVLDATQIHNTLQIGVNPE